MTQIQFIGIQLKYILEGLTDDKTMIHLILVFIGTGNGLVPDGTKPLPVPMMFKSIPSYGVPSV